MREEQEIRILSFLLALTRGVKGRYALSSELGLGQGVLRGISATLASRGLIKVGRGGARLTDEGLEELRKLLDKWKLRGVVVLEDVEAWGRRFRGVAAAFDGKIGNVVEARDEAVRAGAYMALIVVRSEEGFTLPLVEGYDLRSNAPQLYAALASLPAAPTYLIVLGEHLYPCVKGLLKIVSSAKV